MQLATRATTTQDPLENAARRAGDRFASSDAPVVSLEAPFHDVRLHADPTAAASATALGARAYTAGRDIYFGQGWYAPETREGRRLLAHELTHVVQQREGAASGVQCDFVTSTATRGPAEAEAALPAHPTRPPHEIVMMSGGPTSNREDREHDANPLNYVTGARVRIEGFIESAFGDQRLMIPSDHITWVVMRPPYRYRALEDGKAAAEYTDLLAGTSLPRLQAAWDRLATAWRSMYPDATVPTGAQAIDLHFVDSESDFVDFINEGTWGERATRPIGRFEYFGHGKAGVLWFQMGWEHLKRADVEFSTDDIRRLDPASFLSEGEYRSWSCNTATPPGRDAKTFVRAWVERFGGRFVGAVGRTTYEFVIHRREVVLSEEEPAHWATTAATGPVSRPAAPAPARRAAAPTPPPGWVRESALPPEAAPTPAPVAPELTSIASRARSAAAAAVEPADLVCRADVVPLDTPADPGDLVCSPQGAGRLDLSVCLPTAPGVSVLPTPTGPSPGVGYLPVHEVGMLAESECAPDPQNPAWEPFLQEIANRAYHETLDTDSLPGTGRSLAKIASEARARSRGFYIGVVERRGRIYYKIYGARGAYEGIPGRWYAAENLPNTSAELRTMVNARAGLGAGLRDGSIGIGGLLTFAGTTLDYAIDPKKEFGTDYAVDIAFDLVKSTGAGAAAGAAGAAATGWLAAGALGATIGSAAPVIGTVIGFAVGVLAAMAIEYFIEDYRAGLKAWLRSRHDLRSGTGRGAAGGGGHK